ncbi:MAG: TerB family tellurite resistance protein [Sphingomonadales bacterium]|jgi:uncharacterized tellurite resistance protein B-like protein
MPVSTLNVLIHLLGGGSVSEEQQQELYRETLLLTLARAAYADRNVADEEVAKAQELYCKHTGENLSVAEFQHAARSDLFETMPLQRNVSRAATVLSIESRRDIVKALVALVKADENISPNEIEFFNTVVKALNVSYADVAGLIA